MIDLTKNEEFVLLSIWRLKGGAYGVTIRESFKRMTGKTLNFGSLYNTLYLLVRKGYVESRESEPVSQKGGRRKVLYSLTREGKKALSSAYRIHKRAWRDVQDFALEKGK